MTASQQMIYKCGHCKKYYIQKYAAERHEKFCSKNPLNQHPCFQCTFLSVERANTGEGFNEKTFTCTKLDKMLHSYKAEKIGHSCLGYTERMPLKCSDYKADSYGL